MRNADDHHIHSWKPVWRGIAATLIIIGTAAIFGDEVFWTDTLKLHQAIEGSKFGGVGGGVSPKTALSVGLKVDAAALPPAVVDAIKKGKVNLDDPATTLTLI